MAETRHLSALDVNNGITWSNNSNAFVEDENYASTGNNEFSTEGEYCGGNYQDITLKPDTLDLNEPNSKLTAAFALSPITMFDSKRP